MKKTITVKKSDVKKIIKEIKTAPNWKIKKWAKQERAIRKRIGLDF